MRLHSLRSRLARLESVVYERRFALALDSGETVTGMDFSRLVRGCHEAILGERTYEAYIALHCVSAADEYGAKCIELLKACTSPVDT
jgi:hypothetical protein